MVRKCWQISVKTNQTYHMKPLAHNIYSVWYLINYKDYREWLRMEFTNTEYITKKPANYLYLLRILNSYWAPKVIQRELENEAQLGVNTKAEEHWKNSKMCPMNNFKIECPMNNVKTESHYHFFNIYLLIYNSNPVFSRWLSFLKFLLFLSRRSKQRYCFCATVIYQRTRVI